MMTGLMPRSSGAENFRRSAAGKIHDGNKE